MKLRQIYFFLRRVSLKIKIQHKVAKVYIYSRVPVNEEVILKTEDEILSVLLSSTLDDDPGCDNYDNEDFDDIFKINDPIEGILSTLDLEDEYSMV